MDSGMGWGTFCHVFNLRIISVSCARENEGSCSSGRSHLLLGDLQSSGGVESLVDRGMNSSAREDEQDFLQIFQI